MKKIQRFKAVMINPVFCYDDKEVLAVLSSDHDRVVAEMRERIERLEAALTNVRSDLCWLIDRHELPMMLNDTLVGVCKALEGKK